MDQHTHGRRPHHRGRRGPDRRGGDRRPQHPQAAPQQDGGAREPRDHVDVDSVLREIRARIAKGSGLELSHAQIQELAARRLEAVLDPRTIKPALLDALRRGAAAPADAAPIPATSSYEFSEGMLYDTPSGLVRFLRRLFKPLLAVLFNPTPIAQALRAQIQINQEAAARDAARDRRQAEWNALQYEMLQKIVTESSRVSIEMQALALRVESLAAKVDFNERRVRGIEGAAPQSRPPARPQESFPPPREREREREAPPAAAPREGELAPVSATGAHTGSPAGSADQPSDGLRRKRRRRRGRRGGAGLPVTGFPGAPAVVGGGPDGDAAEPDGLDGGDGDDAGDEGTRPAEAIAAISEPPVAMPPDDEPAAEPFAERPVEPPVAVVAEAKLAPLPEQPAPPRDEAFPALPSAAPDQGPQER